MAPARITAHDVRLLLRRFHHHELESDRLGRALMAAVGAASVREAVLLTVEHAPLDEKRSMRTIVRRCDIEGEKTVTVASDLHVSARHFFRFRNAALEALAAHVTTLLRHHTSSAAPNDEQVRLSSLWSLGRRLWRRRNASSLAAALDVYEQCLAIDPAYAPAHAGIGDVHLTAAEYINAPAGAAFRQARTSIERALEIAPDLVEAHVAAADLSFFGDRDASRALETISQIVTIAPTNATARNNAAWYALLFGDFATALGHIDALFALDPGGIEPHLLLAMSHMYRNEPEKAVALLANMLQMEPDSDVLRYRLGLALIYAGRYEEGRASLARCSGFEILCQAHMGYAEAQSGHRREALRRLRQLEARERRSYGSAYARAVIMAGLGMWTEALDALETLARGEDAHAAFVAVTPCFRMLRTQPRFQRIVHDVAARAS